MQRETGLDVILHIHTRIYKKGDILKNTKINSCEISTTLNLGSDTGLYF